MSDFVSAYTSALNALRGKPPRNLISRASLEANDLDTPPDVSEPRLREYISACGVNDPLRLALHLQLATWDALPAEGHAWTAGTKPGTGERREQVLRALNLDAETMAVFAAEFPVPPQDDENVDSFISGKWDPWYTDEIRDGRAFYWTHYVDYLRERRGWGATAIANLDTATTGVIERLSNPSRQVRYQSKGLVVGYVQSGKTANFTGVIAKAIDAGYRLVIVMTGTTNLLREQTQRRLDMELVGRENILRGIDEHDPEAAKFIDYLDDEDWTDNRFVEHGGRPSEVGRPDIHRMTTRHFDYRKLQQGRSALEFERREPNKPLWHPDNLFTSHARLIIVKKNSSVLGNLVKDLKHTADRLENIPALIIDDESDQASVNTKDPRKWTEAEKKEKKERTAINKHLSNLLSQLPRAQYVGYTATPFANVFVDPSDAEDIFPKDFLLSLRRPDGYMGASDFHDLDTSIPDREKTYTNSNEAAHLRLVGERDDEDDKLQMALDSFVLAGAIKLYRVERGHKEFRHHTMLVHETMRKAGQRTRSEAIRKLWDESGYLTGGALSRLKELFDQDFAPVTSARDAEAVMPSVFKELAQHVGVAARRIAPNGNPVLVVNSDKDIEQEELDFDKRSVWRVLVGGNKLARGFTVEGLTISYYARAAGHAEALMQMGRWFGFRSGYRDLVRLFTTKKLRDAFENAVRDEIEFRNELRQYAVMVDGKPLLTPEDVQPLVMRHGLRPTAANKMYNARLVERRSPRKEPSSGYPPVANQEALDRNIDAFVPVLRAAKDHRVLQGGRSSFNALVGSVSHEEMVDVLSRLQWAAEDTFEPDLAWISGLGPEVVDEWQIVMPQQKAGRTADFRGIGVFSIHGRKVDSNGKIRGNAESVHRDAVEKLTQDLPRSGCLLLYPVMEKEQEAVPLTEEGQPKGVVMALMLQLPTAAVPSDQTPLVYKVVVEGKRYWALVDKPTS
ncbi:Z1 domain-containing protein [Actinokineospora sp. G85]|uniref:Z1 domain-containing protein n=1 Tax=Actinokineospora sp. G85 TaxID=3406626 RepID=UPI003C793F8E